MKLELNISKELFIDSMTRYITYFPAHVFEIIFEAFKDEEE